MLAGSRASAPSPSSPPTWVTRRSTFGPPRRRAHLAVGVGVGRDPLGRGLLVTEPDALRPPPRRSSSMSSRTTSPAKRVEELPRIVGHHSYRYHVGTPRRSATPSTTRCSGSCRSWSGRIPSSRRPTRRPAGRRPPAEGFEGRAPVADGLAREGDERGGDRESDDVRKRLDRDPVAYSASRSRRRRDRARVRGGASTRRNARRRDRAART